MAQHDMAQVTWFLEISCLLLSEDNGVGGDFTEEVQVEARLLVAELRKEAVDETPIHVIHSINYCKKKK